MAYQFKSHCRHFSQALQKTPLLLVAQLPEGVLGIVQKLFESKLSESPKLAFLFLYPLFCFSAAICSAITYLIIRNQGKLSFEFLWKDLKRPLPKLFTSSVLLGLVLAPATLALILPGIYVLSIYLFVPFLVIENPTQKLSEFFNRSKSLSKTCTSICVITAFLSFSSSLISYLGPSLMTNLTEASSVGPMIEVSTGLLVSFLLNTWTATLFLEVKQS